MKLNLDKQFLDLTGSPLPDKMDEVLANALAASNIGKPAKMMAWAISLINEGEIEIDKSDAKFLIEFVERHPGISNLAKDQLITEIEKMDNVKPMKSEPCDTTSDDTVRDIEKKLSNLV
jgi:hypothetical protein